METDGMKQCPYCAETVKAGASKCRYCRSSLEKKAPGFLAAGTIYWQRVREEKKVAGVCTGLARQFGAPILILPLRLAFVATTFLWLFGPIFYILLWILMPAPEDGYAPKTVGSAPDVRDAGAPSGSPEGAVGGVA